MSAIPMTTNIKIAINSPTVRRQTLGGVLERSIDTVDVAWFQVAALIMGALCRDADATSTFFRSHGPYRQLASTMPLSMYAICDGNNAS